MLKIEADKKFKEACTFKPEINPGWKPSKDLSNSSVTRSDLLYSDAMRRFNQKDYV